MQTTHNTEEKLKMNTKEREEVERFKLNARKRVQTLIVTTSTF